MFVAFIQAENMLAHADTIFSRPKKTYPVKEKEKRMVANAAKVIFCCNICFVNLICPFIY